MGRPLAWAVNSVDDFLSALKNDDCNKGIRELAVASDDAVLPPRLEQGGSDGAYPV